MRDSGLTRSRAAATVLAAVALLGCRAEPRAAESPPPTSETSTTSGQARGVAGPSEDPFAGIEALRPEPWTGWPLENVDVETEAGWRIDPISGGFELERGLILAADPGVFVLAIAPGEVVEVGRVDDQRDALALTIAHGDGIESRYAPLSDALVSPGLPVSRGAAIGLTAGTSLRLEVTVDGVAIDPLLVLRQPLHRWPGLLRSAR